MIDSMGDLVKGSVAHDSGVEQVRSDLAWQTLSQGIVDLLPLALSARRVAHVLMEPSDHRGPHVLGHHQVVAEVECRRIDATTKQLERV